VVLNIIVLQDDFAASRFFISI